jgi:hypothetical protein
LYFEYIKKGNILASAITGVFTCSLELHTCNS